MAVGEQRFAGTDKKFFTVEKKGGINTQSPRESIRDEQFSWLENVMPIADGNFRALYNNGTALYTTSNPRTIVYFYPYNLGLTNYIAVFLDDGTAIQVNSDTGATKTISATAGGYYPGASNLNNPTPQCAQSGQNYLIIVSTGSIGYSVWDGNLLYQPGSLSPVVTITNNGAGYQSAPAVVFNGGSGSGIAASATIGNGQVQQITVTNPGSGYQVGDVVTVSLVGGIATGTGATLTAVLSHNAGGSGFVNTVNWAAFPPPYSNEFSVSSVSISNGGTGYSPNATASWNYSTANGYWRKNSAPNDNIGPPITLTIVAGSITAVAVDTSAVWGWQQNNPTPAQPTIVVSDPGYYTVTSVTGTPTGTGYSGSTTIVASGGGSPVVQATFKPVIAAGVITGVTIINGGVYGTNTPPTLTINDTGTTATATILLMPFGILGTCVEVYQSRAWVGNGPNIYFSAPGSIFDFSTADGAGAFASNDSFLRREFTVLKQYGSFLYLFADSSINVISNVQQSGVPPIVTFNNQNVNTQTGTPWHNSVVSIEESLIFANIQGVFRLRGGNVDKISDDLDGIFLAAASTLTSDTAAQSPSAALMQINDKLVYLLVVPVQGPLDMSPRNAVVMWDQQRWWVGSQSVTLQSIGTQEVNSIIKAWANTGTTLNKMFLTPSGSLTKTWQSKLWSGEGLFTVKQGMRLYTMAYDESSGGYTFTGTFDYRQEGTAILTNAVTITGTSLTGSGSAGAGARGNYIGFTLQTTKDDFILVNHSLLYQEQSPMP